MTTPATLTEPSTAEAPLLQMTGIRKSFGPVLALDAVDFTVAPRQIHGLLGGNGAGKTTLMNVLYGLYAADAGTIEIDGQQVVINSPRDAIAAGVGMVHQSFLQVDVFTVADNVALGTSTRGVDVRGRIRELSDQFGLAVDPDAVMAELPVGVRQRVEILKALYRGAKILVLDEPTTNLSPQEVDDLFASMRTIVDQGMSVILITHKIRETMAACDAMTIMRDGRWVATVPANRTTPEELAATMLGEVDANDAVAEVFFGEHAQGEDQLDPHDSVSAVSPAHPAPDESEPGGIPASRPSANAPAPGPATTRPSTSSRAGHSAKPAEVSVRVSDLRVPAEGGQRDQVSAVSFTLRPGEVLGVAGVAGNGQVELAEALAGAREAQGSVTLAGRELLGRPTAAWLEAGVVLVPEDRRRDGILPEAGITENLVLGSHRRRSRRGLIDWSAARRDARQAIEEFTIRTPSASTACGQLSGGNIQRVILARAFAHEPKLLILHNPTRGLDIASVQFVYERVREAASKGCSVIVISEDLDEVLALGDRVCVAYNGRLIGDFARGSADPYELGTLMTGVGT